MKGFRKTFSFFDCYKQKKMPSLIMGHTISSMSGASCIALRILFEFYIMLLLITLCKIVPNKCLMLVLEITEKLILKMGKKKCWEMLRHEVI